MLTKVQHSPARQLVEVLSGGGSIMVTGASGTGSLLELVGHMLARTRTRVIRVGPPLDLMEFMRQVTQADPAAAPAVNVDALEQGFAVLTDIDPTCDRIALLVAEAHLLRHETLRYIALALRSGSYLQVALAGEPEIADTLALSGYAGLRKRISLHVELGERPRVVAPAPRGLFDPEPALAPAPVQMPMPASALTLPVDALPRVPRSVAAAPLQRPRAGRSVVLAAGALAACGALAVWQPWRSHEAAVALAGPVPDLAVASVAAPPSAVAALPSTAEHDRARDRDAAPGPALDSGASQPASSLASEAIELQPIVRAASNADLRTAEPPPLKEPPDASGTTIAAPAEPVTQRPAEPQPAPLTTPAPGLVAAGAIPAPDVEPQPTATAIPGDVREPDTLLLPPSVVAETPAPPALVAAVQVPNVAPQSAAVATPGDVRAPDTLPLPPPVVAETPAPPALAAAAAVPASDVEPQPTVAASGQVREPDTRPVPPHVAAKTPAPPIAKAATSVPPPPSRPARTQPHTPTIQAEQVTARPAAAEDGRRCRDIVLRVQLGENPSDADRTYLRNGCR